MAEVGIQELRNNTRSLLRRVEAGDEVTITVDGRAVAVLRPINARPRWMKQSEFFRLLAAHQADPALATELAELAPDSTDDIPLR